MDPEEQSKWVVMIIEFFASFPWILILLGMMTADIFSGIGTAVIEKKLNSKTSYNGMIRKTVELLLVGVAIMVEQCIRITLPEDMRETAPIPFGKGVAGFFTCTEALSVLENAKRCGVPLPSFLAKSLSQTLKRISTFGESGSEGQTVHLQVKDAKIDATIEHEPPKET